MRKIKLYLINGFLGSGKTTLVNELLNMHLGEKIALLVNEYGAKSLDGQVLSKNEAYISEINQGCIFCHCHADAFIETMGDLAKKDLDTVIVEGSGLNNPEGIGKIIDLIQSISNDIYDYQGSITMVDAQEFLDIYEVSINAKEQVIHSDLIIINKCDLVDKVQLDQVRNVVFSLNPYAPIWTTSFARIDKKTIESLNGQRTYQDKNWMGHGAPGFNRFIVRLSGDFDQEALYGWLTAIMKDFYRMKGFVRIEQKWKYLNCTNLQLNIEEAPVEPIESIIAVIGPGDQDLKKKMQEEWSDYFGPNQRLSFE